MPNKMAPPSCRVSIIGAQRQRVAKVAAILRADESLNTVLPESLVTTGGTSAPPPGVPRSITVEYLPCVARFGSYEDEDGKTIRYLETVEHHGEHGTLVQGKSLAPFFDELEVDGPDDATPLPGICAAAVGCGIDDDEDVDKIKSFLESLSSSCRAQVSASDGDRPLSGPLTACVEPNQEHATMKEENEAYRNLSEEEKKESIANGSIGPGKMARFAFSVAERAVRRRWEKDFEEYEQQQQQRESCKVDSDEKPSSEVEIGAETDSPSPHVPNPQQTRYSCRKCRTVLFGVADLENPPHTQSQHSFRKKGSSHNITTSLCQSHFLAQPLTWMDGCGDMEGKLHCPKCSYKVGHYSWTGAQCSCGTWVVPAIMIPKSKVDEMRPINYVTATGSLYRPYGVEDLPTTDQRGLAMVEAGD